MDLTYKVAMGMIGGLTMSNGQKLLKQFGNPRGVLEANRKELIDLLGVNELKLIGEIKNSKVIAQAENELKLMEKHGIDALFVDMPEFPTRLKQCDDAPLLLYSKGKVNLNAHKIISVVGTRSATPYGVKVCTELIESIKVHNPLIVSGLAIGIDSVAHRQALEHDLQTVAVLGHGLNTIYPSTHRGLSDKIITNGALITEFVFSLPPQKYHFPMRNRVIAGLADVTVVVEAAARGGALITAYLARSYNRDVCAYPGHIFQKYSKGCNHLIKSNVAALIEKREDLEYVMGWDITENTEQQTIAFPTLTAEQQDVVDLLRKHVQVPFDTFTNMALTSNGSIIQTLLELEIKGIIDSLPGNIYKLNQEYLNI